MIRALAVCGMLAVGTATAQELDLPGGARPTAEHTDRFDRVNIPVGTWDGIAVPTIAVEGEVRRRAWRIPGQAASTPLQLVAPLRSQLEAQGYRVVLDCADLACGGYDFRFAVEVLPAPAMAIDLRRFHALSFVQGAREAPEAAAFVLASRRGGAAYLQLITVDARVDVQPMPPTASEPEAVPLALVLDAQGFAVLDELEFGSGTAALGAGPFAALEALAEALRAAPAMRITLVGHTDTVGGLADNIALSRDRARAVRRRMIEAYGIDGARLEAEGMGYLSPLTTNATAEGREANRRVEAVVLAR